MLSRIRRPWRGSSRIWGPPPITEGPKPGKGPISGSETCEQPKRLPSKNLGRFLEGTGHRQGEPRPPLLQGRAHGGPGGLGG